MSKNLNNQDAESVALNVSSVIVLSVMLITIVFVLVYPWVRSKYLEPMQQQVTITVSAADSTNTDMLRCSMEVDSIISIVTAKEDVLIKRYEYLLEQYKTEKEIRTTFSVIFGLIISFIGFLGYKSIREIKSEVKSKAEDIAEEKARSIAEITAREKASEIAPSVATIEAHKTAENIANEVAKDVAIATSTTTAKKISKKYLDENAKEIINDYINELMRADGSLYQTMKGDIMDELRIGKDTENKRIDKPEIESPNEPTDEALLKSFKNNI